MSQPVRNVANLLRRSPTHLFDINSAGRVSLRGALNYHFKQSGIRN